MAEDKITSVAEVVETLPNTTFRVRLESGVEVFGFLSGKMRQNFIKVVTGDWVEIEISVYDTTKGRIIRRLNNQEAQRYSQKSQNPQ